MMPMRCWFWFILVFFYLGLASLVTPPEKCYPIADVVFLVDGSDSISDQEFQEQKTFVRRFVEMSDIGADRIHVGYAVVSSTIGDTLNLTSGTVKADVLAKVDTMTQPQEGSRTDSGIVYIDNMFFTQGRLGTMYIGVVLTDGRVKYKVATKGEATVAKNSGVFLIAVGVGRHIQDDMLTSIASTPSNSYHMKPMNYSLTLLTETVKYLGKEWCLDLLPPVLANFNQNRTQSVSDPEFNAKNASTSLSYPKANSSALDIEHTTKPWRSFYLKKFKGNRPISAAVQPAVSLPQTTVYPVTRKNLGKILKALMRSKKARSQGIAFVKSRQDLKDAVKILLASRGTDVRSMSPGVKTVVFAKDEQNKTFTVTTMPLLQVLPTIKPTSKPFDMESNTAESEMFITQKRKAGFKGTVKTGLSSTENKFIPNIEKANILDIFNSGQMKQSFRTKQRENTLKLLKDGTVSSPASTKLVSINLPTQKPAAVAKLDTKSKDAVDKKPNVINYSVKQSSNTDTAVRSSEKHGKLVNTAKAIADRTIEPRKTISPELSKLIPKTPTALAQLLRYRLKLLGNKTSIQLITSNMQSSMTQNDLTELVLDEKRIGGAPTKQSSIIHTTSSPKQSTHKSGDMQEDIAFVKGQFDIQPLHLTHEPVIKYATPKMAVTNNHFNSKKRTNESNAVVEKNMTKTLFAVEGFNEHSGKPVPVKDTAVEQRVAGNTRQVPLSPVSMFTDTGRMSFSLFKEFQQPTKSTNKRKSFSDVGKSLASVPAVPPKSSIHHRIHDIDNGHTVSPTTKNKPEPVSQIHRHSSHQHSFETTGDTNTNIIPFNAPLKRISLNRVMSSGHGQKSAHSRFVKPRKAVLVSKRWPARRQQLQMEVFGKFPPQSDVAVGTTLPSTDSHSSDNGHHPNQATHSTETLSDLIQSHSGRKSQQPTIHPEHYHTMNKSAALELCAKSRYMDGVGYASKPGSCTDFLQCIYVNGKDLIKVEVGHCPVGTYFDEKFIFCRLHSANYCTRDPCYGQTVQTYGHPSNCRGYWRCKGGRSKPGCCPKGFAYSDGNCVMSPNCTNPCLEETPNCNRTALKTNDRFYFEKSSGLGWIIRTCTPGTQYVSDLCGCHPWEERETTVECSPQVSLDFEDGKFDSSKALHNRNVKVEGGVGKFGGRAMITLWRFTGISFGTSVLITMRFKIPEQERQSGKLMHLLSNCCIGCPGRPGPTIDIAVLTDSSGGVVVLSTYSSTSGEKFVFIPYSNTLSGWNSLTYSYDGKWLVGTVNGVTARQQMKGTIESRPYPLLLGSCGTVPSFQGYIDDFKIYLCKS